MGGRRHAAGKDAEGGRPRHGRPAAAASVGDRSGQGRGGGGLVGLAAVTSLDEQDAIVRMWKPVWTFMGILSRFRNIRFFVRAYRPSGTLTKQLHPTPTLISDWRVAAVAWQRKRAGGGCGYERRTRDTRRCVPPCVGGIRLLSSPRTPPRRSRFPLPRPFLPCTPYRSSPSSWRSATFLPVPGRVPPPVPLSPLYFLPSLPPP